MRLITVNYKDGTELMNYYVEQDPCGGLLLKDVPGTTTGERIWLKITLRSLMETIYLSGKIQFKQSAYKANGQKKGGDTMQIALDRDEARARRILHDWIKNDLEEFSLRSTSRRDVWLTGDIFHGELKTPIPSTVRNISLSGLFADTQVLLPKHTKVQMRLHSSTYGIQRTFLGQVSRIERNDAVQGMGIQFLLANRTDKRRLSDLLQKIQREKRRAERQSWWGELSLTHLLKNF